MNSKKAKRIRQLVKHLQHRAAVEETNWTSYDNFSTSLKLNGQCGRAVYQAMKNNVKHGKANG